MAVQTYPSFAPSGQAGLLVSTTSARVAIAAPGAGTTVVMLTNIGPYTAFIVLGDNTVVATVASGTPILPMGGTAGGQIFLTVGANTNVAAITATGNTELRITGGA